MHPGSPRRNKQKAERRRSLRNKRLSLQAISTSELLLRVIKCRLSRRNASDSLMPPPDLSSGRPRVLALLRARGTPKHVLASCAGCLGARRSCRHVRLFSSRTRNLLRACGDTIAGAVEYASSGCPSSCHPAWSVGWCRFELSLLGYRIVATFASHCSPKRVLHKQHRNCVDDCSRIRVACPRNQPGPAVGAQGPPCAVGARSRASRMSCLLRHGVRSPADFPGTGGLHAKAISSTAQVSGATR